MASNILSSFIIGTSAPVVLPFLYRVSKIPDECKNYSYKTYSMIAPLYFGITSSMAALLRIYGGVALLTSLLIITIISIIIVLLFVIMSNSYNFTTQTQWYKYISRIIIFHSIAYLIIYLIILVGQG